MNWYIIFFFFIALSLYAITQYLRTKREKQMEEDKKDLEELEHFQSENALSPTDKLSKYHNITIDFKNANEAQKLIINNFNNTNINNTNTNVEYLQNMNQPNLLARGCSSRDELYNKYLDAFDDITAKERTIITIFILDLLDTIKERNSAYYKYLLNWIRKISIAKAKPWLESGMPHTLENTIIMDADWFINPRNTTFIHEITHVNQRQVPFEFEDLYKDLGYMDYSQGIENIKGMESVIALNRNNPDGMSPNWLWYDKSSKTYWWIGAVFQNITPSRLTDVSNVALKLESGSDGTFYYLKQQPTLLDSLGEFNLFFGINPNNYHPNEMTAKFSEWYLEYILGKSGSKYERLEGFKIYKKYFEKLIKSFYSS
jgi:hypothetical protein